MQIPKQQIELASATEESRYTLRGVFFDIEKQRLVATDGHMMAVAACKPDKDDQRGVISIRAIKQTRAAARRIPRKLRAKVVQGIRCLKKVCTLKTQDGEVTVFPRPTGEFPAYEKVLPKDFKGAPVALLNPKLLKQLIDAITTDEAPGHSDCVAIWIDHAPGKTTEKCMLIAPIIGDALGIIMPMMPMRNPTEITAEQVFSRITPTPLGAAFSEAK
jgi:hypothetical protein